MIILGDYHTHTKFSHGKGTILENALFARSKGIKEIAITDHGFNHITYGVNRKNIEQIKKEIENAKQISGVNVLFGVEANFTSLDGTVDLTPFDLEMLDIVLVGHHRFVKPVATNDWFNLFLPNMFSNFYKPSLSRIEKNTNVVLKALEKYPIDVLTHPGYKFPVNMKSIAKMAMQKGTYIEINGRKNVISDEDILWMAEEGVKFILNSDAHIPTAVGDVGKSISIVTRLAIPHEQIVNLDKLPEFKKIKR
ncbi:MAG: PHP domain-containing protein [Clostridia bacterium]